MLQNIYLTNKEKELLLKSIVILVDTREQSNKHIIDHFVKAGVKFEEAKLNIGDYSFKTADVLGNGIEYDFSREFAIERKGSLEELSSNLTTDRTRFENELMRAKSSNLNLSLLIEETSLNDIFTGNYNTQYNKKSFVATILSFKHRYGIDLNFLKKEEVGRFIHLSAYYYLREKIK